MFKKKNSKIVCLVRTECINEYSQNIFGTLKNQRSQIFYFNFFQCFAKFEKKSSKNMSNDTKCAKKMCPIFESIMIIRFNYVQNIAIPYFIPPVCTCKYLQYNCA